MKNKSVRTLLSVGAAIAVIYFGSRSDDGRGVTNAILVLALGAGLLVWNLTRPGTGKPTG